LLKDLLLMKLNMLDSDLVVLVLGNGILDSGPAVLVLGSFLLLFGAFFARRLLSNWVQRQ
jgi:hypothetical protein